MRDYIIWKIMNILKNHVNIIIPSFPSYFASRKQVYLIFNLPSINYKHIGRGAWEGDKWVITFLVLFCNI